MTSEAQKKAYKKYNQKKKTFSAVYTPNDMIEACDLKSLCKLKPCQKMNILKC